jgi:hypothetical protein
MSHPESGEQAAAGMLVLRANLDCECGEVFEGEWTDTSLSLEDMAEPPVADQQCPACGLIMADEPWPGWMWRSEAG